MARPAVVVIRCASRGLRMLPSSTITDGMFASTTPGVDGRLILMVGSVWSDPIPPSVAVSFPAPAASTVSFGSVIQNGVNEP